METIVGHNLSSLHPLTPLHLDAPKRYVRCNLCNRQVHADSVVENCQVAQVLYEAAADAEGALVGTGIEATDLTEPTIGHVIGAGVRGEITAAAVEAAAVTLGLERAP